MADQNTTNNATTNNSSGYTPTPQEVEKYKIYAILGYIIFFVPLFVLNESEYVKHHANQAIIVAIISFLGWLTIGFCIGIIFLIPAAILAIMGIVQAAQGSCEPLPVIGNMKLIK